MRQVFSKKDGRIITSFEQILDIEGIKQKIDNLIKEVAATDYQVRKCQEYALVGKPLPYDIQAIHEEAEPTREKIRALEALLNNVS
jgi:coenzyme F420-reducing hydrogenase beta subunit